MPIGQKRDRQLALIRQFLIKIYMGNALLRGSLGAERVNFP